MAVQPVESAAWRLQKAHVVNGEGAVGTGGNWMLNFGEWTPYEFGVHLAIVKNGQVLYAEIFPEDKVDEALARFTELTSSTDPNA